MKKDNRFRTSVGFNALELAELNLFKKTHHIEKDGEAMKFAIKWANAYLKNVTATFFPADYEVILQKKRKTYSTDRKVF